MNPPNGQTPLDYLNQIAPEAQKKPLFALNLRTIIIAGVGLIGIVLILTAIAGGVGDGKKEPWQRLSARLDATQTVADSATKHIKSSELRTTNGNLRLLLSNTQRDLKAPLAKLEIIPEKINPKIAEEEASEPMLGRLEDARLNARYDTAYAREMSYQLATLLALLSDVYKSSSAETKTILETAYNNLKPIHKSLDTYDPDVH